ncbi:glycoside hydrolase family 3 N-terminal domain-containing protein [Herbiconiux sp. KACC 21604]|uniref:beta-glucosidase family protein n=1 Tax=unclassified Herbiconiux TaxID=2618217 RepID=UPI0014913DAD|nr:glycoside hydrolase family 3 N-terminal domain-containing protein [Herbiconiux sp. SALV-R1]QJU55228.1 glycosyl hydrolase [Herbiconiux sp. SALV-R1]WPO86393.1 glycoside hydrolase family 3 N-terminal domain-containing protein [Herbiconiux sp. KACC 21604]
MTDRTPLPETPDVPALIAAMSLDEKLAQLIGLWLDVSAAGGADVAPMQHEMLSKVGELDDYIGHGLGQLTRPLGSRVVRADEMRSSLRAIQQRVSANSRLGIPALVHEECLTGLQLYGATTYPSPLAWGASWDAESVREMGRRIGSSMAGLGIHLGLAPVLDLVRDPRWGRVEECISEDPYLVGLIASAYIDGIQSQGPGATLKHFLAYSNSQAGRNLAPVHIGRRELLEQFAVPFEMAVKLARPSSVMHSYAEIDGVPVAADPNILTGLLRDDWGFEGTVVADYFGVAFLHTLHDVAADLEEAAVKALTAGVDVELPTGNAYLEPLKAAIESGAVDIALVDRALERVLRQKVDLGVFAETGDDDGPIDLDPVESRAVALRIAERSVVLLKNDSGLLPLGTDVSGAAVAPPRTVAVLGPNAHSAEAMMGNYSFTNHVEVPEGTPIGIEVPTVLDALRAELDGSATVVHAEGCRVRADQEDPEEAAAGIRAAAELARGADVAVVVVGDRAGLFGRGTVGEGSDTDDLVLPGRQGELVDAVLETGTPVVLVLVTGRPYPLTRWAGRAASVVQAFFPGEAGAAAVAGVLSGRLNPSGHLPVSMPRVPGGEPYSYLHPRLGGDNPVSSVDPAPLWHFGHGGSYTSFSYDELSVTADRSDTSGTLSVSVTVRNTGRRSGADVVQLYGRDLFASVTRPMRALLGWARVELAAGESAVVEFSVPADRLALVSRELQWLVEPGAFEFIVAESAGAEGLAARIELGGETRVLGRDRALVTPVSVTARALVEA